MEVKLGDCWTTGGYHWFCKNITYSDSLYVQSRPYMVRYENNGFRIMTLKDFFAEHPDAELYLREGRHKKEE